MSVIGAPAHDAVPIGQVSAPPFARLPEPARLFGDRAARFRQIASAGHDLAPYLEFLAGLCDAQHAVARSALDAPAPIPAEILARARAAEMPPIDRARLPSDPLALATIGLVLDRLFDAAMPAEAREALERVAQAPADLRGWVARSVVEDAIPPEEIAEHVFVAAGLQVHAARLAAGLDLGSLQKVGEGVCPACGSPPVSSVVVGWEGSHGARFCVCSLCATHWNAVRVRCTACGETGGLAYRELDGSDGQIKAECCGTCRTYLKVMQQTKNPGLDAVADDVATSALDILVKQEGVERSGRNLFLLGY